MPATTKVADRARLGRGTLDEFAVLLRQRIRQRIADYNAELACDADCAGVHLVALGTAATTLAGDMRKLPCD